MISSLSTILRSSLMRGDLGVTGCWCSDCTGALLINKHASETLGSNCISAAVVQVIMSENISCVLLRRLHVHRTVAACCVHLRKYRPSSNIGRRCFSETTAVTAIHAPKLAYVQRINPLHKTMHLNLFNAQSVRRQQKRHPCSSESVTIS
jgi:hypothetical protein